MCKRMIAKSVVALALICLLLPATGCRRGRGSYTNVDVGFGSYLPSFLSGGGYSESFVEEGFVDDTYYDSGYYDSGYYESGYEDFGYGYDDDWKSKNPGRVRK